MAEILFYRLERQTLDEVLPTLLERSLQRGWRAVVQAGSPERLEALDNLLWTYRENSFLPHGTKRDGHEALQPIYLTDDDSNPNGATVRFLVEGADLVPPEGYDRLVFLFDGADATALEQARSAWKEARSTMHEATYWRQDADGRWLKQE
ncbi:MAG: DNA polymerase III subunit chi [Alphaproteobacteria bacterium]|nr:DNA polymerase III subunit chi [Alphaproteobacteria bacterium]